MHRLMGNDDLENDLRPVRLLLLRRKEPDKHSSETRRRCISESENSTGGENMLASFQRKAPIGLSPTWLRDAVESLAESFGLYIKWPLI